MPFQSLPFKLMPVAALALVLHAAGAYADEPRSDLIDAAVPVFSFGGFGTLGVVHSSERNADFTTTFLKPNGAGYSHDWSGGPDSLLAGQVTANFNTQLSAVLQIIAEQNYDNSYRPHVEWANVKYELTPDFSIRAGRTLLPTFLLSDNRKIGYTYPWARPPLEVYQLNPLSSSEGVDVSYRLHVGDLVNTMQFSAGKNTQKSPNGVSSDARAWGFFNTLESGPLIVRATYVHSTATVSSFSALFDAFRQFGPQGADIANRYELEGKSEYLLTAAASYDPGNWFVMSEWGRFVSDSAVGTKTAWYVSAGYRLGKFTPYVTYAQARADNLSDPGLNVASLPPALAGPASGLNAALNSILSTKPVQNTVSVGSRWDFMKNLALKVQFDRTSMGAGSSGTLSNLQPGFQLGGKVDVFSATLDFVF